jgi:hypothetical protein
LAIRKRKKMLPKNLKSVGWKDMHPFQVEELAIFIGETVKLARKLDDGDALWETKARAHELIRVFGGGGLTLSATLEEED